VNDDGGRTGSLKRRSKVGASGFSFPSKWPRDKYATESYRRFDARTLNALLGRLC
jgi:hypothetical protein